MDNFVVAPSIPYGGSCHASDYLAQGGGMAATAIVAAARLGAVCKLYSMLGDDSLGNQIRSELKSEGIDISKVIFWAGGRSPFSLIHVDESTGERTIFHRDGSSLEWIPKTTDFSPVDNCDALLVDHCYPLLSIEAATRARNAGVPVVADVMINRSPELIKLVDVLIAPRAITSALGLGNNYEAAMEAIHQMGPNVVVITLGNEGWVYSDKNGTGSGKAFDVDVVDTTGAGDVFHGAYAYGLTQGWDTAKCCEFAGAVSAIKCTKRGGRTGIPSYEQALDFLRQHRKSDW